MAYDLHGSWESTTGHNAPLFAEDGQSVVSCTQSEYSLTTLSNVCPLEAITASCLSVCLFLLLYISNI